ncbi:zinc finger BED domain-containing protein RICESLEEPER 1-like isoform X2 [Mangifera indica]|nr:zinc finger BED domain-containing protein RICESLEEPER 1-like isoform X2 [Mangifera indica]
MDMSDAVIVNSSRLKSVVWNDFDRMKKGDTYLAVCRHCKKKLSGSSTSGTSHLRNHLIRCQRRSNHVISNHGLGHCFPARGKKKEGTLSLVSIDQEQKKDEAINLGKIKYEQEPMEEETVNIGNNNFDQRRSRYDLARMIILHGYPLTMVEHVGFRIFVKNLQPLFELVTSNRVEADCMEIYAKEKQKVYEVLDKLPGKISISADGWATTGDSEYLCLTAHFIDEDWQLKKKTLNFIMTDPSLTEDVSSEAIMTCLMDWDIDRKLFAVTFDNGASNDNMVYRIKDRLSQNRFLYLNGQLFDVRCATNVVCLMVQDALEAVCDVTYKIRQSIQYVKSSQSTLAKFNEVALEIGVESPKWLCVDNPSQWNSTYSMLKDASECREVFFRLQEYEPDYRICPSDLEWERVNAIIGCLKLFVEVTNVFTKSKYMTANIYFPEICDIHLHLIEWCKNPDEFLSSLALKMRSKFDEYWDKCNLGLAVAAMLDPRFKMRLMEYYYPLLYENSASELIDDVFECIKTLYNEHSIGSPLASLDQGLTWQVSGGSGTLVCSEKDSRDKLMGFDKYLNETSQTQGSKSDLDKYLEEPLFPRNVDFNVLNWWKVHTPRYPILSMMARNILGIPMSKVEHGSAFNIGKRVLDHDRSSLRPTLVQALMCSQDWMRE